MVNKANPSQDRYSLWGNPSPIGSEKFKDGYNLWGDGIRKSEPDSDLLYVFQFTNYGEGYFLAEGFADRSPIKFDSEPGLDIDLNIQEEEYDEERSIVTLNTSLSAGSTLNFDLKNTLSYVVGTTLSFGVSGVSFSYLRNLIPVKHPEQYPTVLENTNYILCPTEILETVNSQDTLELEVYKAPKEPIYSPWEGYWILAPTSEALYLYPSESTSVFFPFQGYTSSRTHTLGTYEEQLSAPYLPNPIQGGVPKPLTVRQTGFGGEAIVGILPTIPRNFDRDVKYSIDFGSDSDPVVIYLSEITGEDISSGQVAAMFDPPIPPEQYPSQIKLYMEII